MKYRKKPVEITAVKFGLTDYHDGKRGQFEFYGSDTLPQWLQDALDDGTITPAIGGEDYWYLDIRTLEGAMRAAPDDWVVRGVKGELYPVKPGVFQATYEPVACWCGMPDGDHDGAAHDARTADLP